MAEDFQKRCQDGNTRACTTAGLIRLSIGKPAPWFGGLFPPRVCGGRRTGGLFPGPAEGGARRFGGSRQPLPEVVRRTVRPGMHPPRRVLREGKAREQERAGSHEGSPRAGLRSREIGPDAARYAATAAPSSYPNEWHAASPRASPAKPVKSRLALILVGVTGAVGIAGAAAGISFTLRRPAR